MSLKSIWAFGIICIVAIFLGASFAVAKSPIENAVVFQAESTDPTPEPDAEGESGEPASAEDGTEVEVEKLSPERLESYEKNLEHVRERIFKSKSRLMQLYEQLKLGNVSIVGISILHTHKVGSTFKLESISYNLDGFEVYGAINDKDNSLEKLSETPVYEGSLLPGEHLLVVDMVFRGKGYGIFSYLNQYLFKVKSRYSFNVVEGDVVTLKVESFDKGSFLTPLKERLRVKFDME